MESICREVLKHHEPWLRKELLNWPYESCFDTCATIQSDLQNALKKRVSMRDGYFYDPQWESHCEGHVWLEVEGTIVDPTAGQFIGGDPLHLFTKDHPAKGLYSLKYKEGYEQAEELRKVLETIVASGSRWNILL